MATSQFSLSAIPYPLQLTGKKIGIATADWNSHITHALRSGAENTLLEMGMSPEQIVHLTVPGAFELPSGAQMLMQLGCDAVICLGCVIQGDTPHFEYVCRGTTDGIMQVALSSQKPCIFGVLTTNNEAQALQRAGGTLGNKGSEAALSAVWMLAANDALNQQHTIL